MKKLATLATLISAVAIVGCTAETPYTEPSNLEGFESVAGDNFYDYGNMLLRQGEMRGDVGSVRGIDSDASMLTGYDDGEWASVEVHADTTRGSAMNLLEVQGGMDELEPGFEGTFSSDDYNETLNVQVINCSGDSRYDWDYDAPADEVDVVVTEGSAPGDVLVDYEARTFRVDPFTGLQTGEAEMVTGSFEFTP